MTQFKKILYFVDVLEPEPKDLLQAVRWAEIAQARITFCAVVNMGGRRSQLPSRIVTEKLERVAIEDRLADLTATIESLPESSCEVSARVLLGEPAAAVIGAVKEDGYDLVIKAPAGPARRRLDTTEMRLLRACPCAVNVTRPGEVGQFQRLLAAVDIDPSEEYQAELNRAILRWSSAIQQVAFPELHIVHAWTLYGETLLGRGRTKIPKKDFDRMLEEENALRHQQLVDMINDLAVTHDDTKELASRVQLHLVHGDPVDVIPHVAEEIDAQLLVMSTASRTRLSGLLIGNTAESVLNRVECSVLTVKPEGFASPNA